MGELQERPCNRAHAVAWVLDGIDELHPASIERVVPWAAAFRHDTVREVFLLGRPETFLDAELYEPAFGGRFRMKGPDPMSTDEAYVVLRSARRYWAYVNSPVSDSRASSNATPIPLNQHEQSQLVAFMRALKKLAR